MRHQSREYLAEFLKDKSFKKVLEVGSLDVNGIVKDLFVNGEEYTGSDMRPGGNVDVVVNGHELDTRFDPESFDLVICFDTLEHDDAFWLTVEQMRKVLKPGGWLMIGVPSRYCPEHDHPHDYWRFMPQMMKDVFLKDYLLIETKVDKNGEFEDEVYGWGQKP